MNKGRSLDVSNNCFFKGENENYPVLMPLTGLGKKTISALQFCREISPGASVLIPDLQRYMQEMPTGSRYTDEFMLESLSAFLFESIVAFDIGLCPIIVIGHGSGADLGAKFATKQNVNLAAAILYRPNAPVKSVSIASLTGLHVLLVTTLRANIVGSPEWKIKNALSAGGAQVICEYVAPGSRRSKRDAALARVFLASLFGISD